MRFRNRKSLIENLIDQLLRGRLMKQLVVVLLLETFNEIFPEEKG